ncbi:unnamed protein product [Leptosia nina]|uniref:Uncharacterized protein n=1 Tax=Leptosia nina TaxID=320188 RepID=A0AAV1K4H4_9NEOP
MEEDGPQPMRNRKPAQRTKNGVDKFWDTHQEQYEARGKRSGIGRVARVKRHNAAFPKLIDELNKRTSLTKITTANSRQPSLRNSKNVQSSRISKTDSRKRSTLTRIRKYRSTRNRGRGCFITRSSQCAYVLVKDKKVGAEIGTLTVDSKLDIDSDIRAKPPQTPNSGESRPQSNSGGSYKYPDTSIATMSSYNSYASLDQEPMV